MNTFLICLSLKYVKKNYKLICKISKWIYFELEKHNYNESKFIKSLDNKDFKVIKTLIKFNKDIDLVSRYLVDYCSFKNDYFDIIKLLIDNGADIHTKDDLAIGYVSEYGHLEIAKLLIDNGANVHGNDNYALKYASENDHLEIVKLLIDNGADIHAEDDYALRHASEYGNSEIVELLIDNGADVNADNDYALRWAYTGDNYRTVKLLIDNGADVNARCFDIKDIFKSM